MAQDGDPAATRDLPDDNVGDDAASKEESGSTMGESGVVDIADARRIGPAELRDTSGGRITVDNWLSSNISEVVGREVVYVDRHSPLLYPRLRMSDDERQSLIRQLLPGADAFSRTFLSAGGPLPGDADPSRVWKISALLARLDRLREDGHIDAVLLRDLVAHLTAPLRGRHED